MSPGQDASARARLAAALGAVDRRLRAGRLLRWIAPAALLATLYLVLRDVVLTRGALEARGLDVEALQSLLAVAAVAAVGVALLRALRDRSLKRTAAHCDRRAALDDLLLSAWSLGERVRPVDPHWLELLEERAAEKAEALDPKGIAPIRMPASLAIAAILLITWLSWTAVGGGGLISESVLARALALAGADGGDELADLESAELPPAVPDAIADPERALRLSTRQLPPDLELTALDLEFDGTIEGEISLGDLSSAEGLSVAERGEESAGSEDGASGEGGGADAAAGSEAGAEEEILQELRRETDADRQLAGEDPAHGGGESGARGERRASGSSPQEGEVDPEAPVEQVDFPLAQSGQARQQSDGDPGQTTVSGAPSEDAESAGQEASGPMAKNPFGSSTGPQSGAVDPFGQATELEVTLELAILEQQQRERPDPAERNRRAAPQKSAEVARRSVRASEATEEESVIDATTTPWRFRSLSRRFFAPEGAEAETRPPAGADSENQPQAENLAASKPPGGPR